MAIPGSDVARGLQARRFDLAAAIASPWGLILVIAISLTAYAPTLSDWFTADDFWFLRASQQHSVWDEIQRSFDYRNVGTSIEFDRYRPLYPIAWRLQYEVFGTDAFGYRAVLLALHTGCIVTVWAIAGRLSDRPWARTVAALVFGLHPAYSSAISWISGGNRVYMALPYLLALLLYMRARQGGGTTRTLAYVGSVVLFLVAVLFHSSALSLLAPLAGFEFFLLANPSAALQPKRWVLLAPYGLIAVASAYTQAEARANIVGGEYFRLGYHIYANLGGFLGRLATPLQTQFLPSMERLARFAEGGGSVALIALCIALIAAPKWRLGAFASLWLVASILPDSTFILGPSSRATYLPAAAVAIVAVATAEHIEDLTRSRGDYFVPVLAAIGAIIAIPLVVLASQYTTSTSNDAAANEHFIATLERDIPRLPAGTLYIVNAPPNLRLYETSSRLDALVELRYGDADVRNVPGFMVAEVEKSLGADDVLYHYQP